jgi:hypothetical protein
MAGTSRKKARKKPTTKNTKSTKENSRSKEQQNG